VARNIVPLRIGEMAMRLHRIARVSVTALAFATAWPSLAQTEPQAPGAGDGEIIVTAQRRSESLQEVPISITALSGDTLRKAGIQDTESLATLTPGLLVQRSVVGKISIRGVGNENYTISGDPGVAVHSDGVYVARAAAGLFDLFDIERVEVLRGPQGTLYGRNATGGVINVLPNRPEKNFGARIAGEVTNYNGYRVDGMVNVPLADDLAVRVAVMRNSRDGFTTNTNAAARARGFGDLDSKDVWAFRGQFGTTGGSPFEMRATIEYLDDNSNLPPYKYLNRPTALPTSDFGGGANAFLPRNLRVVNEGYELAIPGTTRGVGTDEDVFKSRQLGIGLHLKYDFGSVALSSITGFRSTQFNWLNDGDGADIFYVNYIQQDDTDQFSEEVQLTGGGDRLEWLLGGYYFNESGKSFIALPFTFGAALPFYIRIDGTAKTDAIAGFGELRWKPTDRLKITVGARYSHEKRAAAYRYEINFGAPFVANPDLKADFNAFTPRVVVNYEAVDDINIYASATRGFKSGGFNLLAIQPGFAPEKVWTYEAGIKTQFADRRITFNANVFYAKYDDIQVGQIINLSSVLTNAAKATLKGAEVEFSARPNNAIELGATLAYLDAKYDNFCTGDPTRPTAPVSTGCTAANPIQLAGNRFPRAPEFTLTGTAAYTIPIAEGGLTLRGDVRYQSKTYFTQFNRPEISQDGYTVVNARLTYTGAEGRYSFGGFVNNLFDKTYFTEVLESGAFNPQLVAQAYVAPPRTYGVTASFKF
jgi:iron complex outermembrane recepter protein